MQPGTRWPTEWGREGERRGGGEERRGEERGWGGSHDAAGHSENLLASCRDWKRVCDSSAPNLAPPLGTTGGHHPNSTQNAAHHTVSRTINSTTVTEVTVMTMTVSDGGGTSAYATLVNLTDAPSPACASVLTAETSESLHPAHGRSP